MIKYRARMDESLSRIAKRFLGDGTRWTEIADLNYLTYPYLTYTGQTIFLPDTEEIRAAITLDVILDQSPPSFSAT